MLARRAEGWRDRCVLVTGGTGTFGRACVAQLLGEHKPRRLVVLSRDELKQAEARDQWGSRDDLRWFLGDVRDRDRLSRAFRGVDVVFHAAALKRIDRCELDPGEAVATNVIGTRNVLEAAIDAGVECVVLISSDKAVAPANLYGATKLCAERLAIQANVYGMPRGTRFVVVRYGNVLGSRGSVIERWRRERASGTITVTDQEATRFWLRVEDGVRIAIRASDELQAGEIWVPRLPSVALSVLAAVVAPGCRQRVVGLQPGEKCHEALIAPHEAASTTVYPDHFVIAPPMPTWQYERRTDGTRVPDPEDWSYTSATAPWLSQDALRAMLAEPGP